jgi:phenylalanine ammonia-lyase
MICNRHGVPVRVDGQTLSLAGVVAVARHGAYVALDDSPHIMSALVKSRDVIENKVNNGTSVYGLSTGFGGSGTIT